MPRALCRVRCSPLASASRPTLTDAHPELPTHSLTPVCAYAAPTPLRPPPPTHRLLTMRSCRPLGPRPPAGGRRLFVAAAAPRPVRGAEGIDAAAVNGGGATPTSNGGHAARAWRLRRRARARPRASAAAAALCAPRRGGLAGVCACRRRGCTARVTLLLAAWLRWALPAACAWPRGPDGCARAAVAPTRRRGSTCVGAAGRAAGAVPPRPRRCRRGGGRRPPLCGLARLGGGAPPPRPRLDGRRTFARRLDVGASWLGNIDAHPPLPAVCLVRARR